MGRVWGKSEGYTLEEEFSWSGEGWMPCVSETLES